MFYYRPSEPILDAFDPPVSGAAASDTKEPVMPGGIGELEQGLKTSRHAWDITLLLLVDMSLMRECLSLTLKLCDPRLHVQTAMSVPEAASALQGHDHPDVVLSRLSDMDPRDADFASRFRELVEACGTTPLVVLSDYDDAESVLKIFQLGARGVIPTTVRLSVALEAIRLVAAGGIFVPTTLLHRFMGGQGGTSALPPPDEALASASPAGPLPEGAADADRRSHGLTPRQLSVLKCLKEGKPNKIIAHELGMRESTVKVHVRGIFRKLGATNRTEAVYRTLRNGD